MADREYRTVVFEVVDPERARSYLSELIAVMGEEGEYLPGIRVTAVSLRDEISAVEELEMQAPSRVCVAM